jgi:hypothetical protein
MVTLSVGSLGATPRLLALGRSFAGADVVSLDVSSGRWRSPCPAICRQVPDTTEMHSLGAVVHADPRFTTIVRLGAA